MSGEYPIKVLYATLAVSRSGYYAWARSTCSTHARRDRELRAMIALVHRQSRETYGSPRITVELRAQGEAVDRHRVARLMRQDGLRGRQRRRYRVRTTDSRHSHPIAPNRLAGRRAGGPHAQGPEALPPADGRRAGGGAAGRAWLRPGNTACVSEAATFLGDALARLPPAVRVSLVRADSGGTFSSAN